MGADDEEEPIMTDAEIEILSDYHAAHDEIVMLRRAVAELKPKATALDILERLYSACRHPRDTAKISHGGLKRK